MLICTLEGAPSKFRLGGGFLQIHHQRKSSFLFRTASETRF